MARNYLDLFLYSSRYITRQREQELNYHSDWQEEEELKKTICPNRSSSNITESEKPAKNQTHKAIFATLKKSDQIRVTSETAVIHRHKYMVGTVQKNNLHDSD